MHLQYMKFLYPIINKDLSYIAGIHSTCSTTADAYRASRSNWICAPLSPNLCTEWATVDAVIVISMRSRLACRHLQSHHIPTSAQWSDITMIICILSRMKTQLIVEFPRQILLLIVLLHLHSLFISMSTLF